MCKWLINHLKKIWCIPAALLCWFASFYTDPKIFNILEGNKDTYYVIKLLYLAVLYGLWRGIQSIICRVIEKDSVAVQRILYGGIYGIVLTVILILVWPGIWRTDEFGILGNVVAGQMYWWQHFLTSVFYMLSFMLLPFPTGVILVQIVIVSAGVGYFVQTIGDMLGLKKWKALLYLPFILPPVILFQLYPMRLTLYAMLEIVLVCFLLERVKHNKDFSWKDMFFLVAATVLLSNWRSEGIYYIVLLPVIVFVVIKGKKQYKKYMFYLVSTTIGFVAVWMFQSNGLKTERNDAYEITAYAQSLVPLMNKAYEDGDSDGLAVVDHVVSVEEILQATKEGKNGIECFWSGYMTSKEYTDDQFADFKKQYVTWICKYPDIYMKERLQNFLTSYEQTNPTDNLKDETNIPFVYFLMMFSHTEPLFPEIRAMLIHFMEHKIWYANWIPILALAVMFFYQLRRNKIAALLIFSILVRVPLVFLTAPDNYFMYYYSMYVAGNIAILYMILCLMRKIKKKK